MNKILFLIFLFNSTLMFSNSPTDTIRNWQVYKDKILLLKSNETQTIKSCIINLENKFNKISINVFSDIVRSSKGVVIQVIYKNKVIKRYFQQIKSNESFTIQYNEIISVLKNYKNKEVILKYIDEYDEKGFEIGKIKIKS